MKPIVCLKRPKRFAIMSKAEEAIALLRQAHDLDSGNIVVVNTLVNLLAERARALSATDPPPRKISLGKPKGSIRNIRPWLKSLLLSGRPRASKLPGMDPFRRQSPIHKTRNQTWWPLSLTLNWKWRTAESLAPYGLPYSRQHLPFSLLLPGRRDRGMARGLFNRFAK